jgi:hypothetical protein
MLAAAAPVGDEEARAAVPEGEEVASVGEAVASGELDSLADLEGVAEAAAALLEDLRLLEQHTSDKILNWAAIVG